MLPTSWRYGALIRESSKILGMTKNAAAAEKYAIFLRWMTDKRVMWPRDYTLPEDEKRIRAKVQEVDAMYAALKESLQQKGMSA